MMDLGKVFRTDRVKEVEGSWINISGSEFLIARSNNRTYKNLLSKTLMANAAGLEGDSQEVEDLDVALMAKVLAETILLDWKSVEIDGKKVKYSKKAAENAMREMPDFLDLVRAHANNIDNFKAKEEKVTEKNS